MRSTDELIGDRLRELRIAHKETQADIGKLLNLHYSAYGKVELGKRKLSNENCIKLAEHFGTTTEFIYSGVNPESVDFNRKTGLSQAAIDALAEDGVFSAVVNALVRYRYVVTQNVRKGAQAVHDTAAMHLGEEYGDMTDYSTMLDYPCYQASRQFEDMYKGICMEPSVVRAVCGDDEATQSWEQNNTVREML